MYFHSYNHWRSLNGVFNIKSSLVCTISVRYKVICNNPNVYKRQSEIALFDGPTYRVLDLHFKDLPEHLLTVSVHKHSVKGKSVHINVLII